jgi:hypothetical protein
VCGCVEGMSVASRTKMSGPQPSRAMMTKRSPHRRRPKTPTSGLQSSRLRQQRAHYLRALGEALGCQGCAIVRACAAWALQIVHSSPHMRARHAQIRTLTLLFCVWCAHTQRALEAAMAELKSAQMDPKEKWKAIAEKVPGKTDKECIKRVKEIKALLAAKAAS